MKRIRTTGIGATGLVLVLGLGVMADEPAPLRYTTSWVGNSFGGGPDWVQNFAEGLCVLPDGTCVVGSFWDEAGREVGLYKDGRPVGMIQDTHMRGGKAVAASEKYLFYAHTCARQDQPAVGAGEARRDVPICLFGVSRYTIDGKAAPFPGGKTHLKNMVVLREAPDNHDLIARGLAADGKLLFLADTLQDRIRVFDVETMAPVRDFAAERPERLALDRSGNVWAIKSGGKEIASYSADGKAREVTIPLPSSTIATSLSFAPDGRLVVTDNGPRQQLLFFDISAQPATPAGTFGEEGGMFAGPHPGRVGPTRFAGPTGAGYDAKGNLYVSCNVPRGGTVLRAFAPDKTMTWEALGLEFVDVADAAPGSNGRDVFTADDRFSYDPSGPSGKNWKWVAHTLDPFRSPDDLRLHFPGLQCGTSVRVLGGKTFLCQRGMWQGILGLYRVDGDLATPSVVLSSGPLEGGQDRMDAPAPARVRPMALARRERQRQVRRGRIYQDRGAVRRILGEQRRPPRRPLAGRARHRYLEVEVPRARRARQPQVRPQARAPADARAVQRPPAHRVRPRDRHDVADRPDQGPADLQRRVGHRRDRRGPV